MKSMSMTQVKTRSLEKEKRGNPLPSVRPQPRIVTRPTAAVKPTSRTVAAAKPTSRTVTAAKPISRTVKPATTAAAAKVSSSLSPKQTVKSSNLQIKDRKQISSSVGNGQKLPNLNGRGGLANNGVSSVRIQRCLSMATTAGGARKLVQPKSAPSPKTLEKSVPRSQTRDLRSSRPSTANRKPREDNAIKPKEAVVAAAVEEKNQEVNIVDNVNETEDNLNQIETHVEQPEEEDKTAVVESNSDQQPEKKEEEEEKQEGERFLKASEIRRRMEAQVGNKEVVRTWPVVRGAGSRNLNTAAQTVSNEVIEETTMKLIKENKRNKVLAMVGAFETVMSNH